MDRQIILIVNTQATGDALIGTHAARFIKQAYPNSTVIFCIRNNLTLTTAENNKNAIEEVLDILELQEGIDDVGIFDTSKNIITRQKKLSSSISRVYQQHGWYADLGIVKSALIDIAEEIGWNNINTETQFSIGKKVAKREVFTVATAGTLDWNRKIGNHLNLPMIYQHIKTLIPEATIIPLGRDVSKNTYLESLKVLASCHLYIGPIGSMSAAAAGLGLDTINVCSVFPPSFDSPEFYHSGNHHSVTAKLDNHCGDYKCIRPSYYKKRQIQIGNPPTEFPFWTSTCTYMQDKKSCISNITEKDILEKINLWFKRLTLKIK